MRPLRSTSQHIFRYSYIIASVDEFRLSRETVPLVYFTSSPFRRGGPKSDFIMFFKAIALLIAAIVGYYLFDTGSEQGAIFLALPVSAIAVVLLLGWSS